MDKELKIWFGTEPASQEQLDAIEEIVVEQEVGHIWEARIKIPVSLSEDGHWEKENDEAYQDYHRVRIEVRIGTGEFTPLIDGRIMSKEPDYNASPGLSAMTLIVQDDSTKLHLKSESESYQGQAATDVINALFETGALGGEITIDKLPAAPDPNAVLNRHGTAMDTLRAYAARYRNFYAYVLPGGTQGVSDAFFKKLPAEVDDTLAPLFLEGPNGNLTQFTIRQNADRLATFEGQSLNLSDNTMRSGNSAEVTPAEGEAATQGAAEDTRHRRLSPGDSDFIDLQDAADNAAAESSFTLTAEGSVLPEYYSSILMPYKRVPVRLSDSRYSGSYVIFKVTHTMGHSEYTQSFSMRGDAVSPEASTGASAPAPAASAGALAAVFNIQADIY